MERVRVILGLLASCVNLCSMFILGRHGKGKRLVGWYVYILSQALWLSYALVGHLYEMTLLSFGASAIAAENLWSLKHRMGPKGNGKSDPHA